MCVRLIHWPIDRICRRRPKLRLNPLVLVQTSASRQSIADLCPRAAAQGIRRGMTLAEARALCLSLQNLPHEPNRDEQGLLALGRWLMRFTPIVSPLSSDTLFLDCTGCQRLYGSLEILQSHVQTALKQLNIRARLAIAPTPGAAWAMASYGNSPGILQPDDLPHALCPLPPDALRLDPRTLDLLSQLGVQTIGQLMNLPRQTLPARFGPALLQRLDEALGKKSEPLTPLPYSPPVQTHLQFEAAIDSLEILRQALRVLIGRLIPQLTRRGCGARLLRLEFFSPHSPSLIKTIRLASPSRSASIFFNLLSCALETVGSDEGFIAVNLTATMLEQLTDAQFNFIEQEQPAREEELTRLIDLLAARLGSRAFLQPQLVESHLPEKTYRYVEPSVQRRVAPSPLSPAPPPRPLCLLPTPVRITAVVSPSDDDNGKPVSFTHNGQVHRLNYIDGPERIAPLWWEGRDKTRDYFDVEDEAGRRFWIFRVVQTGRWYLHGKFG
jgi:protein ImuB